MALQKKPRDKSACKKVGTWVRTQKSGCRNEPQPGGVGVGGLTITWTPLPLHKTEGAAFLGKTTVGAGVGENWQKSSRANRARFGKAGAS